MYAMCDVLAKHHPGNGMIEHGRLLLVDVIVVKQVISIRIKSIALEAFGRHLKRVDASVLFFCLDVRFGQAKQGSHLGRNKYPAVFRFGTRGLRVLFGSAGKKSEISEHKPNFGNKTAGRGRLKQGVCSVDLGFSPHFRKRPTEVCGIFWNPRAHRPFHEKNLQVEALPLSSVVDVSRICRTLPDFA